MLKVSKIYYSNSTYHFYSTSTLLNKEVTSGSS